MAQATKTLWAAHPLTSSYTAYRYNDGTKSTSTPSTVTASAAYTYAEMGIPAGATINWVRFRVESFGSPMHGSATRNATINGTSIASTVNAATDYAITGSSTTGTNTVVIRFQSGTTNTSYPAIPPTTDPNTQTNSGTLTWNNVTVTVDYTAESASTLTLSTTTINAGASITPTITPGMGAASHKITWQFGTRTQDQTNANAFTLPLAWLDQIPDAVSGMASATLTTYRGASQTGGVIGSPQTLYFTVNAPASVVPTVSALTATRVNNTVPSAWGVYVQGKSGVNLAAAGDGIYGSSIVSWLIQGDGKTGQAASLSIPTISGKDSITFTATVTDSRGRIGSKTVTITVQAYSAPSVKAATVIRSTSGGVADTSGRYASVSVTAAIATVGSNAGKLTLKYRLKGASTWTNAVTDAAITNDVAAVNTIGGDNLAETSAYEIQVTVGDTFGNVSPQILPLGTADCFMDRLPGQKKLGLFGYVPQGVPEKTLYLPADGNIQRGGISLDVLYLAASAYTAADVLVKLLTVDGAGSGLDADTVDGKHAAALQPKSTLQGSSLLTGINPGTTRYVGLGVASTAYNTALVTPYPGVLKNLWVITNGAPGVTNGRTFTLMVNNVATAITCTMGSATNVATDLTHTVNVTAGSRVSLQCVEAAESAGMLSLLFALEYET